VYHSTLGLRVIKKKKRRCHARNFEDFVGEAASSGPLFLAPVSAKSSKNARFIAFFEVVADTGAK